MKTIVKGLIGREDFNLGSGTFTRTTSSGGVQTMHQVNLNPTNTIFADQLAGVDNSAKIAAAIALLPATGGIVDARGLLTEVSGGSANIDPSTKPVTVLLGPGTTFIKKIVLQNNFRLLGSGQNTTTLQATDTVNPAITLGTAFTVAQGVEVAGFTLLAPSGTTSTNHGIYLQVQTGTQLGIWYSEFHDFVVSGFAGVQLYLDASLGGANGGLGVDQFNKFQNVICFRKNVSPWVTGHSYNIGDTVTINGGAVTTYAGGTAYVPGKLVLSGGNLYMCIANTTGNAPPNGSFWTLITQAKTAFTYVCTSATSSANPLNTSNWATYHSEALYLSGNIGQSVWLGCEFDGTFGGTNHGINIRISATSNANFSLPYSNSFHLLTSQYAAVAVYVTGGLNNKFTEAHHEGVYTAYLVDYDSSVGVGAWGNESSGGVYLTNACVNGGAGSAVTLTSNSAPNNADFTFERNTFFNVADNVIVGNGSLQIVSADNNTGAQGATNGPYTGTVPSIIAASSINIPRVHLAAIDNTTPVNIATITSLLSPGERLTLYAVTGTLTLVSGGNITIASTVAVPQFGSITLVARDGATLTWIVAAIESLPTMTLKAGSAGGDYTHSGDTSFVDVDATNLSATFTVPVGWKLLINAAGQIGQNSAVTSAGSKVAITDISTSTILHQQELTGTAGGVTNAFGLTYILTGDGNAHTIRLQFGTGNASDAVDISNVGSGLRPTMTFLLSPSN